MNFFNQGDVPFEHIRYIKKKDISMSTELKAEFMNYYRQLQTISDDVSIDTLLDGLADKYSELSKLLIEEIRLSGDKKSTHTEEEMEFIFWCMYLLIDKFAVPQGKIGRVFNISQNKFIDFDLYPERCHSAYAKKNYVSLVPNNSNSSGVRIAKIINRQIQAVYGCSAFVGVTNDLDVFANISSTDTKNFILTSPLEFEDNDVDAIRRANYAYATYLFAMGNNIFDDGKRVPAGKIKECIIKLLKLQGLSSDKQDGVLSELFLSEQDLSAFVDNEEYSAFNDQREEYRKMVETVEIADECLLSGVIPYGLEYEDPHFGGTIDGYGKEKFDEAIEELDKAIVPTEEVIVSTRDKAQHRIAQLYPELVKSLDIKKLLSSQETLIESWINTIRRYIEEELIFSIIDSSDTAADGAVLSTPTVEERINAAASYWVSEVFKHIEANGSNLEKIEQWLKTGSLLSYLDCISKEVPKNKIPHVKMVAESDNISGVLSGFSEQVNGRPLLVYIDTKYLTFGKADIEYLSKRGDCIVVIHDEYDSVEGYGYNSLCGELHLYMYDYREGR